jgi:hypothetical protein
MNMVWYGKWRWIEVLGRIYNNMFVFAVQMFVRCKEYNVIYACIVAGAHSSYVFIQINNVAICLAPKLIGAMSMVM